MAGKSSSRGIPAIWIGTLLGILVAGVALGFVFRGESFNVPVHSLVVSIALGIVWAYLIAQLADLIGQAIAFFSNPIPEEIDLNSEPAIATQIGGIKSSPEFLARARRLLTAWTSSNNPRSVIQLAAFQSTRARRAAIGGALFALILLGACIWQGTNNIFTGGGLALLAIIVFAKLTLLSQIDNYFEANLLSRLPAGSAGVIGTNFPVEAMGQAIDTAFGKYIPQPDQLAAVIREAVESAGKQTVEQVQAAQGVLQGLAENITQGSTAAGEKTLAQIQEAQKAIDQLTEKLNTNYGSAMEKLEAAVTGQSSQLNENYSSAVAALKESLGGYSSQLGDSYSGAVSALKEAMSAYSAQVNESTSAGVAQLQEAFAQHAAQFNGAGSKWKDDLDAAMSGHVDRLESASQALAGQLEKIAALEADIGKVLHIQEAVDGALKTVTASDEFKNTMSALRSHVEEAGKIMGELARPRTITLVESEED